MRILSVFGTRPEAIKMAPVVRALAREPGVESLVCVTGQHREMLAPVLELFGLVPDVDLEVMRSGQSLNALAGALLTRLGPVLERYRPERVLVHGDTTTTLMATLAAYHLGIPVGHVEAGLRTGDLSAPWPEEGNRRLTSVLADLHFAPTARAAENLRREGVPGGAIRVTGNTVIDALLFVVARLRETPALADAVIAGVPGLAALDRGKRLIVVTGHRRESFGGGFEQLCAALRTLADRADAQVVYPVHLNPNVRGPVCERLADHPGIVLLDPLDYVPFVALLDRATLIITDSGGIQEEAPSLGKPVLVTRAVTERPEAVEAGTVRLVGTDQAARIVSEAERLLDDTAAYQAMAFAHNPYGDGHAAARIVQALVHPASATPPPNPEDTGCVPLSHCG